MTPEEILENNGYDLDAMNEDNVILFRNPDYADGNMPIVMYLLE